MNRAGKLADNGLGEKMPKINASSLIFRARVLPSRNENEIPAERPRRLSCFADAFAGIRLHYANSRAKLRRKQ
jgi:hypothetical protein